MTGTVTQVRRGLLSRVVTAGAGELVSKAAVTVAFIHLARVLEPSAYGAVEWALSLLMVGTILADAGLGTWAAAQIGAFPERAAQLAGQVGWLRFVLACGVAALLAVLARTTGGSAGAALTVYALALLLTPLIVPYLFNGLLRSEWAGLSTAVRGVVFAAGVLLFVRPGDAPVRVAAAELAGATAAAVVSVLAVRFALRLRVQLRGSTTGAWAHLAQSWMIGASDLTWAAVFYAGLIVLGAMAPGSAPAWFGAALRIVLAAHSLVYLYFFVLLPSLAHALRSGAPAWRQLVEPSLRTAGWLGGLVAVVGTLGARPILSLLFGAPFEAAAPSLRILVWIVPVLWLSGHHRYSFVASNRPALDSTAAAIGAVATIVLSLVLVPVLRGVGAAVALLAGVVVNAVSAAVLAGRALPRMAYVTSVRPGAAASAGCLVLGAILTPVAGDIASTLIAAATLTALAAFIERGRWPRLQTHADC